MVSLQVRKGDTKYANDFTGDDKILKKNGFEVINQNGSHIKMRNPNTGITVIVPHHSKDLKKGMEQAILKQAGLK